MLLLLPAQPVVGRDARRPRGLGLEPVIDRPRQRRLGAQPPREAQLGEAEAEAVEQLAQRPQALQLLGPVQAISAGRAAQHEQSGPLDVAKHPRRPAGRVCGLVDRERVHRRRGQPYHNTVNVVALRGARAGLRRAAGCGRARARSTRAPTARAPAATRRVRPWRRPRSSRASGRRGVRALAGVTVSMRAATVAGYSGGESAIDVELRVVGLVESAPPGARSSPR